MIKNVIKSGVTLFIICLIASISLGFVNGLTKDIIFEQQLGELKKAVDNFFPDSKIEEAEVNVKNSVSDVFKITKNGELLGYIVQANPAGYADKVKMVVGIDKDGLVLGYDIIAHSETPPIGGKLATDQNIKDSFKNKKTPLILSKEAPKNDNEVEVISGATITSNAVVTGINDASLAVSSSNN